MRTLIALSLVLAACAPGAPAAVKATPSFMGRALRARQAPVDHDALSGLTPPFAGAGMVI